MVFKVRISLCDRMDVIMSLETRYVEAAPGLAAFQETHGGIGRGIVVVNQDATQGRLARDYVENVFGELAVAAPGFDALIIGKERPLVPEMLSERLSDAACNVVYVFAGDSTVRTAAKALIGTRHRL
jgi:hypothetical protein